MSNLTACLFHLIFPVRGFKLFFFSVGASCLQVFNSIRWYVFFTCVFSLFQGYLVNGVINAIISTLEKRFELPSSKSGLIVSSNDFIAFFLVLFISFYGGERHKPRLIGIGIVTLGIGSFIFSLPHFLAGSYSVSGGSTFWRRKSVQMKNIFLRINVSIDAFVHLRMLKLGIFASVKLIKVVILTNAGSLLMRKVIHHLIYFIS